jgi:hypothetical protein
MRGRNTEINPIRRINPKIGTTIFTKPVVAVLAGTN